MPPNSLEIIQNVFDFRVVLKKSNFEAKTRIDSQKNDGPTSLIGTNIYNWSFRP